MTSISVYRSVKLATSNQLLVAGYLFWEKLATSNQLLVTGYLIWEKLAACSQLRENYRNLRKAYKIWHDRLYQIFADITLNLVSYL